MDAAATATATATATAAATSYHFHPLPGLAPAPHWRALEQALAQWVRVHGGSVLLARLAAELSLAEARGDSALCLDRPLPDADAALLPLDAAQLEALRAEALVGDGGEEDGIARPFVLDGWTLYLRRNHRHECRLAQALRQRLDAALPAPPEPLLQAWLDALFDGADAAAVARQREAVAAACRRQLLVLTGGPGTGKTSTLLKLLLTRLRAEPGLRVRLCAPTGKAARRIAESLRSGREALHARLAALDPGWQPALDAVAGLEPATVHRVLGARGPVQGFRHHAGQTLPLDLLVVDETSMLDLGLLRTLLDALPDSAQLVLVGDPDQLSPVDTGSVLLDLVGVLQAGPQGRHPSLVRLEHSFRADRALLPANDALRRGDAAGLQAAIDASDGALRLRPLDGEARLARLLRDWARELQAVLEACGAFDQALDRAGRRRCFEALRGLQLLCALREGPYGALAADAAISAALAAASGRAGQLWYPGRPIIITTNDPSTGLLNGDVGLFLRDEQGRLRVHFEVDGEDGPDTRDFGPGSLPAHAGACALTVHRSQGSEYRRVAVLLPVEGGQRILSRQLLYTALTRARQQAELWTSETVLAQALGTPLLRSGGLAGRLA